MGRVSQRTSVRTVVALAVTDLLPHLRQQHGQVGGLLQGAGRTDRRGSLGGHRPRHPEHDRHPDLGALAGQPDKLLIEQRAGPQWSRGTVSPR